MKIAMITAAGLTAAASAQLVEFDFQGNAGFGLLPGNEVGNNVASADTSDAFGGEAGDGLVFDTSTNILSFDFEFEGLTGGLFNAASGIHFHIGTPGTDPFNETGGIAYNLNSGTDPDVTIFTPLLATDGSVTGARVTGEALIAAEDVADLFAGNFYLNIHSGEFTGGELRGNLVPAPASVAGLGLAGLLATRRRR